MPKAYWVVTYRSMKNPDAWKAYAKLARPAISYFNIAIEVFAEAQQQAAEAHKRFPFADW